MRYPLDADHWAALRRMLDRPARINPKLRNLFDRPSVFAAELPASLQGTSYTHKHDKEALLLGAIVISCAVLGWLVGQQL